jgi:hypothetical protein
MASASQLILYFILILVVTVVVLYLLMGTITGKTAFISSRLGVAKDTLTSIANSAISEAESIIGQAFDFAKIVYSDVNTVLQAIAKSMAQIIDTIGVTLVDLINFIVVYHQASNGALVKEINGFFSGLVIPIFDTFENIVRFIVTIATALYQTFNPTSC